MFGGHYFGRHYWSLRYFGDGGEPVPLVFPTSTGQIITADALLASFSVDGLASQITVDALSSIITADIRSAQIAGG